MAHWYDVEGNLVETYEKKRGGLGKVTLRQARTMGLLPSVTTIIQATIPSFGLQLYRENQILDAAATEPRSPDDDDASWKKKVKASASEHADTAAAEGTVLHDQIRHWIEEAAYFSEGYMEQQLAAGTYNPVLVPVFEWLAANVDLRDAYTEKVWVALTGQYAGTIDLVAPAKDGGAVMLVDFKSQYETLRVWDDFPIQLAGYAAMIQGACTGVAWVPGMGSQPSDNHPLLRRVSLVFARDIEGGKLLTREYDADETLRHDRIWTRCLLNWRDINKYWPGKREIDHWIPANALLSADGKTVDPERLRRTLAADWGADDPFVRSLGGAP